MFQFTSETASPVRERPRAPEYANKNSASNPNAVSQLQLRLPRKTFQNETLFIAGYKLFKGAHRCRSNVHGGSNVQYITSLASGSCPVTCSPEVQLEHGNWSRHSGCLLYFRYQTFLYHVLCCAVDLARCTLQ